MGGSRAELTAESLSHVQEILGARGGATLPLNFMPTVPAHDPSALSKQRAQGRMPQQAIRNPQTVAFLKMLGLPYNLDHNATAPLPPGSTQPSASLPCLCPGWPGLASPRMCRSEGRTVQQPLCLCWSSCA